MDPVRRKGERKNRQRRSGRRRIELCSTWHDPPRLRSILRVNEHAVMVIRLASTLVVRLARMVMVGVHVRQVAVAVLMVRMMVVMVVVDMAAAVAVWCVVTVRVG